MRTRRGRCRSTVAPGRSCTNATTSSPYVGVRPPDHRRGDDVRVGEHRVLDIPRIDVDAAADDQVLEPVDDVEVAVGVEPADVAGVQPAAAHRVRRLGVGVPVAGHQRPGPGRRSRRPHRPMPAPPSARSIRTSTPGAGLPTLPARTSPSGEAEIRAAALGAAVALGELDQRQPAFELRRGSRAAAAHRREVIRRSADRSQLLERVAPAASAASRAPPRRAATACLSARSSQPDRVEPPHQDDGARARGRAAPDGLHQQPVGVRERQRHQADGLRPGRGSCVTAAHADADIASWLSITPFERPVVPPV